MSLAVGNAQFGCLGLSYHTTLPPNKAIFSQARPLIPKVS